MRIIPSILGIGLTLIALDLYIKQIDIYYSTTGTTPVPTVYPIISLVVGFVVFFIVVSVVFRDGNIYIQ
jgi:hypothetical protein